MQTASITSPRGIPWPLGLGSQGRLGPASPYPPRVLSKAPWREDYTHRPPPAPIPSCDTDPRLPIPGNFALGRTPLHQPYGASGEGTGATQHGVIKQQLGAAGRQAPSLGPGAVPGPRPPYPTAVL